MRISACNYVVERGRNDGSDCTSAGVMWPIRTHVGACDDSCKHNRGGSGGLAGPVWAGPLFTQSCKNYLLSVHQFSKVCFYHSRGHHQQDC